MGKLLLFIVYIFTTAMVWAGDVLPHQPSDEILQKIQEHNLKQSERQSFTADESIGLRSDVRPFAEYETTGYVFFNDDDFRGNATAIKNGIAANLPQDVTLVVYSTFDGKSHLKRIRKHYLNYIPASQLLVIAIPPSGSSDFWTRDNLPVPVFTDGQMSLVDAKYYYNFEPDQFLAELFSVTMTQHNYFFEGGNFITNSRGDCIVVNRKRRYPGGVSDTGAIPDSIFYKHYGCNNLTRLPHLKGIGHSDEVVKYMSDDVIVTDTEDYVADLEALGLEVHVLPEPDRRFETYANALQVNDVLFVPSFGESGDDVAVNIYQQINPNLHIVPLPSRNIATRGQGGIHCITMNYPPVPLRQLLDRLNVSTILP